MQANRKQEPNVVSNSNTVACTKQPDPVCRVTERSLHRRNFLRQAVAVSALTQVGIATLRSANGSSVPIDKAEIELPRLRVPASFIIDDSTCLVNMGRFCMPQFAAALPERKDYQKPWRQWPSEIPDAFVREFGLWCAEYQVRGKYSIVPYPACVGWLDRSLPGWSQRAMRESLKLVRELMVPNWDIHPEMITHTRVIDLKTGRPMQEINAGTMENSYPQEYKSVDQLAAYLAYALKILQNCELPCEGITTPGGFGNRVKKELPLAVHQAVRAVYGTELPHYFKYVMAGEASTVPRLENLDEAQQDLSRLVVNVPAGTGDWFGGWDGDRTPEPDRYANREATSGRMVELIERKEPAVMLCHWPGLYSQGTKAGFRAFQQVVRALHERFRDQILWMKISDLARYYAAKELTQVEINGRKIKLDAPFATKQLTLRVRTKIMTQPLVEFQDRQQVLSETKSVAALKSGRFLVEPDSVVLCIDLEKGATNVTL